MSRPGNSHRAKCRADPVVRAATLPFEPGFADVTFANSSPKSNASKGFMRSSKS